MDWKIEWKKLAWIVAGFLACFYLPVGYARFDRALLEAAHLVKWYAREHVLLCLIPAFFIAGAIGVFVSQAAVMKYLGPAAKKIVAYGVASVSGSILAVCSCTILPLFTGIYKMGAGLGPACAFLYSGPAINVLAMIMTARILGPELGIARAVGAVVFSGVIGYAMHLLFRKEEAEKAAAAIQMLEEEGGRPLWQTSLYFASMVLILVFANFGKPQNPEGLWAAVYGAKWALTAVFAAGLGVMLVAWFKMPLWKVALVAAMTAFIALVTGGNPLVAFTVGSLGLAWLTSTDKGEGGDWFDASWSFAKQILPLLLIGVVVAGFLLGRVGEEGMIPSEWVNRAVGGNSLRANFLASISGAFMYFATLTEVPIIQGLMGAGMGKGPALALLLAGPALSLPSMLVINSVLGPKKTVAFVSLVVVMATVAGWGFGMVF
ncbi:MAG: permease [Kiritimatiellae bacterium]|nr:permease [Kiritimatiellia bacterium]